MRPLAIKGQDAWEDFFDQLAGTPRHVVADMDASSEGAVKARFPRRGDRPPDHHWSDPHVRNALENVLAPLHGEPPAHPVCQRFERPPFSIFDWDRFVRAVEHEDRAVTPLPAALLTLGLTGQANQRNIAKAVRIYLEGHHGRPQLKQRPHDHLTGAPSLFA